MFIYLDTNFLVKLQRNTGDYSKCLASLKHRVANSGWRCATSDFAVMEFVDVLQEHAYVMQQLAKGDHIDDIQRSKKSRVLERRRVKAVQVKVDSWLAENPGLIQIEEVGYSSRDLFRLASSLCLNGSIMAPDAVHLAVALLLGCDIVLTGDELFRQAINKELAQKRSVMKRTAFRLIEEITGAPVRPEELDAEGRMIRALKVTDFISTYPPPRP